MDGDPGEPWDAASDSDEEAPVPPSAGACLVDHLLHLYLMNKMSAEDCCVAMYHAKEAGVKECAPYALKPGSSSGHYNRKMKTALGHVEKAKFLYQFDVPGSSKLDLARTSVAKTANLPHDRFARDWANDAASRHKLDELRRYRKLPPPYTEHKVVVEHPAEADIPVALYLDAVPNSQTDSVLGWWLVNLISGVRYLYGVLRKSQSCRCGCLGYCSFYQFFALTHWILDAMASARFPVARHDNRPWRQLDCERQKLAGDPLGFRAACIWIKGDWSVYAGTLGLPSWADALRPCFKCSGCGSDLFQHGGNSMAGLRWRVNGPDDYFDNCRHCTRHVTFNREGLRTRVVASLRYDKRKQGSHGRALQEAFSDLGLDAGDRLEPSAQLADIANLTQRLCRSRSRSGSLLCKA